MKSSLNTAMDMLVVVDMGEADEVVDVWVVEIGVNQERPVPTAV